jgi:4'-phosphopantetheinyl transferase
MDPVTIWLLPSETLTLAHGEIHIWRVLLDHPPVLLGLLSTYLSAEEAARAERFVFTHDKNHFIVRRGMLRVIVGRYLGMPPRSLLIEKGPYEKPCVSAISGKPPLHFNLSHSHGLALYAFALHGRVGIDLEMLRPEFATREVAEQFFSPTEQGELFCLPPESRIQGFFNCWTRKEAYVKATGKGLTVPLDSFDVSLTPGCPPTLRVADSDLWSVFSFCPAPGYAAAAIVEGKGLNSRFYDWDSRGCPSFS